MGGSAGITFSLVDLNTLGGSTSEARAISDAGYVTGNADIPSGSTHAFLWDAQGGLRDLGTLWKNQSGVFQGDSYGYGVNDAGVVVGEAAVNETYKGLPVSHAYLFNQGTLRDIGGPVGGTNTLGGKNSRANAINTAGTVVGAAQAVGDGYHAFRYDGAGPMTDLDAKGQILSAVAINDAGVIAGNSVDTAFVFANGAWQSLGVPPGFTTSRALGLSSFGDVAGFVSNGQGSPTTPAMNIEGTWYLLSPYLPDTEARINSLNFADTAIGVSRILGSSDPDRLVFFQGVIQGNVFDLATLVLPMGQLIQAANAINASDRIAGKANHHACMLVPIPRRWRYFAEPALLKI